MSYGTFIPTIVSLVLALTASRAQNRRIRLEAVKIEPLETVPTAKNTTQALFRVNNASRVFIHVICNFYPYYCLFGFGSDGLQGPE